MASRSHAIRHLVLLSGAAVCGPLLLAQVPAISPPAAARVVLISLDGMGTGLFLDDPVSEELRTLRSLRSRGVMADGLVAHMPSTTANTHAALWTGAWGDANGITANEMPLPPRDEHPASATVSGYRSEGLRAEPLWVATARQGVRTVTQQATQVYPVRDIVTGGGLPAPLTLLHGYQAPVVAPARWLVASDLTPVPCRPSDVGAGTHGGVELQLDSDRRPDGRRLRATEEGAVACFTWAAGPVTFRAALSSGTEGTSLRVGVDGHGRVVTVPLAPTESEAPRGRDLARHFSAGLLVDLPGIAPVMAYFRLFEASPDGRSIVLFQSVLQEALLYTGHVATRAEAVAWLEVAGGFVGNGAGESWDVAGRSGIPIWQGGDGTRERRYLETLELGIRQTIRQAQYLWRTQTPRFLLGYVSMPDEMDHAWLGHARTDRRYEPLRRWGYQLVDRAVDTYAGFASEADHVVFVSDHGMTPITHEVRVNHVLRDAGLVAVDARGRLDRTRSQVLFGRNCLLVHTTDWKGGVVPVADRDAVLARAIAALRAIRAPDDARPVITAAFSSRADRDRLGFGGPNGHDACFDARPGYMMSWSIDGGPVVRERGRPTGDHGYLPTRPDMLGILIAAGPRLPRGGRWPLQRAIDVAPLVSDLLGVAAPRDARGRSPLRRGRRIEE